MVRQSYVPGRMSQIRCDMPLSKLIKAQQGSALIVALIWAALFQVVAYYALQWAQAEKARRFYEAEAVGLLQVQRALTQYAKVNQIAFKAGKEIMYINDQFAPTIADLQAHGFLTASGPEVTAPWGRTFATTLTLQATGAITGAVYLTGSIPDSSGNPDRIHACNVAATLREIGACTPPNNSGILGNAYTQIPNPSGAPGAVGALVSIPP